MSEKSLPGVTFLMVTGIGLLVLGIIAVVTPAVAGTAVVYVIGGVLLVSGAFQLVQGLREKALSSKLLGIILGSITALCGGIVLAHPMLGLSTLAWVLAAFFVIEGIWKIIASFSFRSAPGWLAMLVSGILALVLAYLIFSDWPFSGIWAVGILVGVDLISTGVSMLALGMTLKHAHKAVSEAKADSKPGGK